jgi:hypothetical protein
LTWEGYQRYREHMTTGETSPRQPPDSSDIDGILQELTDLRNQLWDERTARAEKDVPQTLYHFTSAAGASAILNDGSLLASHAPSLNDASEIRHGTKIARAVVESQRKTTSGVAELFARSAIKALDDGRQPRGTLFLQIPSKPGGEGRGDRDQLVVSETFVTCFCPTDKRLLHWLHYGRSGDGYALGFEARELVRPPFALVRVVYGKTQQTAIYQDAYRRFEEKTAELCSRGLPTDLQNRLAMTAGRAFALLVADLAGCMKKAPFRFEEEWRLITRHTRTIDPRIPPQPPSNPGLVLPEMSLRAAGNRVVPEVKLQFKPQLPLKSITVGSKVDLHAAHRALSLLLCARDYPVQEITISRARILLQ